MPAPSPAAIADLHGLPRQFWLLAAGTLVYLIGVEMSYPYETLYLNGSLGVSMTSTRGHHRRHAARDAAACRSSAAPCATGSGAAPSSSSPSAAA